MRCLITILLFLVSSCATHISKYEQHVAEVRYLFSIGEWGDTVDAIDKLEKSSYFSDELVILRARSEWQLGHPDESLNILRSALEKAPHSETLSLELVILYLDIGQYQEANNLAVRIFQRGNPGNQSRKLLGFSYMKLGNWSQAQLILEPLFSSQDDEAVFWYGQSLFKDGKFQAAIPAFSKTFSSSLFKKRSAHYLAWIYTSQKKVTEANSYIRFLILDNPKDFYAQKMLIKNILNVPEADKVTMLKLFNDSYKDDWGRYTYFSELKNSGMKEDALNYIAGLWNENPTSPWIVSNYANELHKTGDQELAKALLNKSINLAGSSADSFREQLNNINQGSKPLVRGVANVNRTYKVQAGDTFLRISQILFKTTSRSHDIHKLNIKIVPRVEDLRVGMEILIPEDN